MMQLVFPPFYLESDCSGEAERGSMEYEEQYPATSDGTGRMAETTIAFKPAAEVVRSIRGKYSHLHISIDEFMREKREDAERGY